jgi:two-component system chemotaxis response regulator CheB
VPKIRALVVDDAVVFRQALSKELSADPMIEVVGTAANGRIALQLLTQVNPEIVILDVEMPELDGLATLRELRKTHPKLPVIMFSALTERGAAATLEALSLGATDYFAKPSAGLEASFKVIRDELIPEIKMICGRTAASTQIAINPLRTAQGNAAIEAVAIATSTGGPNALAEVFSGLPASMPVPIFIVQHMPPMFTRLLAERLTAQHAIKVEEATSNTVVKPSRAWIAPGDYHMIATRDGAGVRLALNQDPPENSCRPAADVLFRSLPRVYGPGVLAVVMTGMGQDGLRGCEAIKEAGGRVIVQDEASSVVWGMPGYVAKAGLADKVLPLPHLAAEIVRQVRNGRGKSK